MAAGHARAARPWRQPGRVPRAYAARIVPGSGVLLHAQGRAHRAAARRDADRFRLCRAYARRQFGGRRQDQRTHRAGAVAIAERRRGRDHPRRRPCAAGRLGGAGRHRQGAGGDPPRDARGGAHAICRARPADRGARLRARRPQPSPDDKLKAALPRLARRLARRRFRRRRPRRDLFRRCGEVRLSGLQRGAQAAPRQMRLEPGEPGWFGMKSNVNVVFKAPGATDQASAIPIRGLRGDVPVRFAPEGGAVPGDRIVGILTPGEGITIYPIQSPALTAFDDQPDRWLDVRWDIDPESRRAVSRPASSSPRSTSRERSARWRRVIGETGANIDNVSFSRPFSRLSRDAIRSRGRRSEAFERHHRAAARQRPGQQGRARQSGETQR